MGGYGSGRPLARPVAEQSLALPIELLRVALANTQQHGPGIGWRNTLRWTRAGDEVAAVSSMVVLKERGLVVRLIYTWDGQGTNDHIPVVTTQPR